MKKKDFPKEYPGWTALTGVRANCRDCGKYVGLEDVCYWRKESERTRIKCEECVKS